MLSIGEIAHFTGVSRRMLRHWEEAGLIVPASIDEHTGYRRYARSQIGRVRAIAALRSVGFGLEAIGDLLGPQLTQQRLVELLRIREEELVAQIEEASKRLTAVHKRLDAIKKGHRTIMNALELGALPDIRLASLQASVADESEIGNAVSQLLPRLRGSLEDLRFGNVDIVLTYDGTADDLIVVTAGAAIPEEAVTASDLRTVEVAGSERGVTVGFDLPPADIGDAWISLDASLEEQDLETTGVYRQTLTPHGGVILQAPLRDRPRSI
jgi:DNA-binding transcriptional MerR regulator